MSYFFQGNLWMQLVVVSNQCKGTIVLFILLFFNLSMVPGYSQDEEIYINEIDKAVLSGDTTAIIRAWYALGRFYDDSQQIEKSNDVLKYAVNLAEVHQNFTAYGTVANYLASNLSQIGESDSAIFYFSKAIDAFSKVPDIKRMAFVLINLGDEYASRGRYIEAAEQALRAIRIKESNRDSTNLAYVYQKVGEIYKLAGETKKWEDYVQKAYSLINIEDCASLSAIVSIYNDLGGIAEIHEEYDLALQYYDTLIHIAREHDYRSAIGVALNNCAIIYKKQGDLQKALDTAIESQSYNKPSAYSVISSKNLLAELYLAFGNFSNARHYAIQSVEDEKIDNFPEEKMRAVRMLYQIDKGKGDYENSLLWMEMFKHLNDSIREKEMRTSILDLEMAYQTEKKEAHIELLTAENRIKAQRIRNGVIILVVMVVIILLILYILHIRRKQSLYLQNDLQQKVLRSQMNPHFIFNVLGSIQSFMISNEPVKASGYLSRFASLVRSTLEYSASESISLEHELEMLKNYIELEQMRMPGKFDYTIELISIDEPDFIHIPPMLIQPFVENAVKHGVKDMERDGRITIRITDLNDMLKVEIDDNGVGITSNANITKKHASRSGEIVSKRLQLLRRRHKRIPPIKISLLDINTNRGTRVEINIPILNPL
jgi:tetratricopeptide (TPR) repeat protein